MSDEHPFAQYVRVLGKGPNLSRPLTQAETAEAVRLIMAGVVEPVQLGAFLCLLRVKTETPEEVAGFVQGARDSLDAPETTPAVDLDWPTYAGKARQLPWYLLAALLLADNGVRVFMHGTEGHTEGRVYAREGLAALGITPADSLADAAERLDTHGFAFANLHQVCPRLQDILDLRPLLGVRSPVHTVARTLNPLGAPAQILSVAHPNYRDVHQQAAELLGQSHMAVFKGEGGEAERRPGKVCTVHTLHDGTSATEEWPPIAGTEVETPDESLDPRRLAAVWEGDEVNEHAANTIVGTAAVALKLIGRADSVEAAEAEARRLWDERNRNRLPLHA